MATTTSSLPKRKPNAKRKARKKQPPTWLAWWPLVLGVVATPFAVKAATLLALTGPDGLRLLYPWMLIPKLHLLGLSDSASDSISQVLMYLEFPLYGLAATLIYRAKGALAATAQVALVHLFAVALLFLAGRG